MSADVSCPEPALAGARRRVSLGVLLLAAALPAGAQVLDAQLPISLDADRSELDLRANRVVFRGLRITQGTVGIEADRGETRFDGGNKLDFDDSTWQFEGNVRIEVDTARIESDSAELRFTDHRLARARVQGAPARFRDSQGPQGNPIEGEAGRFEYDLGAAEIRFEENARIREGGNEITGSLLLYDIADQKVLARGDDGARDRVTLTVIPPETLPERRDGAVPEAPPERPDAAETPPSETPPTDAEEDSGERAP